MTAKDFFSKVGDVLGFSSINNSLDGLLHGEYRSFIDDYVNRLFGQDDGSNSATSVSSSNNSSPITIDPQTGASTLSNDFSNYSSLSQLVPFLGEWLAGANPEVTRQWNTMEAQKERDWQTEMSNTAYQRSVADMSAAGINPILAYSQGGATSGVGASATATPSSAGAIAPLIDSVGKLVTGIMEHDRKSDKDASDAALAALKFKDSHSANEAYISANRAHGRLSNARSNLLEAQYKKYWY